MAECSRRRRDFRIKKDFTRHYVKSFFLYRKLYKMQTQVRTCLKGERNMKKKRIRTIRRHAFSITTVLLLFVTVLSMAGTVNSRERDLYEINNPHIIEEEKSCMRQVKSILEEHKCKNSGITMTKTMDIQGSRQYEIVIHHDKIARMSRKEKGDLCRDLEQIKFSRNNFTITYEFLP